MEQGLLTDLYYDEILKIINEIRATERENILKAARMIADQVKQDKLVYVFGPGGDEWNNQFLERFRGAVRCL